MNAKVNYISPPAILNAAKPVAQDQNIKGYSRAVFCAEALLAFLNSCLCFPFYVLISSLLFAMKQLERIEGAIKRIRSKVVRAAAYIIAFTVMCVILCAIALFAGTPGVLFFPLNAITGLYAKAMEKTAKRSLFPRREQPRNPPVREQQPHTRSTAAPQENHACLMMAEGLCERMLQNDLGQYLLHDFQPQNVLSALDLKSKVATDEKLRILLRDICAHIGLRGLTELDVIWSESSSRTAGERTGSFSGNALTAKITISIKPEYAPDHVMSILCHECVHAFMQEHCLNWNDTGMNEERTDIMAILLGFADWMVRGYRPVHFSNHSENPDGSTTLHHKTIRVGYITDDECRQIHRYLLEQRPKFLERMKARERKEYEQECLEKQLKALHESLENNLRISIMLLDQCSMLIDATPADRSKPGSYAQLSSLLAEYEALDAERVISEQKALPVADPANERKLVYANAVLEKLCADMSDWMFRYKSSI